MSLKQIFDAVGRVMQESTTEAPTDGAVQTGSESDGGFNYTVFWVVNAVVVVVIVGLLLWCCKFGGAEFLVKFSSNITNPTNSDLEYARRVVERQRQLEEEKKETPAKRKAKLRKSFVRNNVKMVVEEKDFVEEKPAESSNDIETGASEGPSMSAAEAVNETDSLNMAGDNGFLTLTTTSGSRTVPNCCAVCLGAYEVGEKVVWSAYKECPHAFHEECVVDWFIKMQNGTPCPCCRQEFTDLEELERKKKEAKYIAQTTQFNINAISLR